MEDILSLSEGDELLFADAGSLRAKMLIYSKLLIGLEAVTKKQTAWPQRELVGLFGVQGFFSRYSACSHNICDYRHALFKGHFTN